MAVKSAGILLYKRENGVLRVLLVHPGGPFWAKKDAGAWSIPKGEYSEGEDPEAAARREFAEELGVALEGELQLRDRVAAEERAQAVVSRGRPGWLVHPGRCPREAPARPAHLPRPARPPRPPRSGEDPCEPAAIIMKE